MVNKNPLTPAQRQARRKAKLLHESRNYYAIHAEIGRICHEMKLIGYKQFSDELFCLLRYRLEALRDGNYCHLCGTPIDSTWLDNGETCPQCYLNQCDENDSSVCDTSAR